MPIRIAWSLYVAINLVLLAISFRLLMRLHGLRLTYAQGVFLYAAALFMSGLLVRVGQVTILQLASIVIAMAGVRSKRPILVAIALPLIVIKPHLVLLFVPALLCAGGKRVILASIAVFGVMLGVSALTTPGWLDQLITIFVAGQARNDPLAWNFTALPALVGLTQDWNYWFAVALVPLGALVAYRTRFLPSAAWLSVVLAISLAVAPYSFAYDLPLLLPALLWLTDGWSVRTRALWLSAVLIAVIARYSSGAYLVTLLVVVMALRQALAHQPTQKNLVGNVA